jgi:hypothetical protein
MRRACGTGVVLVAALLTVAGTAMASGGIEVCVPKKQGSAVVTPKHGKCTKGFKLTSLGAEGKEGKAGLEGKAGAEGKAGKEGKEGPEGGTGLTSEQRETLKMLLQHIKYIGTGVGGKPTIQFSGVNVQVVNGEGRLFTTNGEGNLVIGYDGNPRTQTGSENLILGNSQEYTSFGGILAGFDDTISAPYASVTGGLGNHASGDSASVSGGENSEASGFGASVSGGDLNHAEGSYSSIFGGKELTASHEYEAIP